MSATELLKAGQLKEALQALTDEVRNAPDNAQLRIFLFQMFCVVGQWNRALTQLNVLRDLDPAALQMVQTYQEVLNCEGFREAVFAGQREPLIFGDPAPWIAQIVEAIKMSARGEHEAAAALREQAFESAPATSGRLTVADATEACSFAWIADADSRLGPLVEAVVNGKYFWIPFDRIQKMEVEPPSDLRDLVWTPAHFVWANEGRAVGMIPTRYPGSEQADDALRLARRTEWQEAVPGTYVGMGQRILATDVDEYPLTTLRSLELDVESTASDDPSS